MQIVDETELYSVVVLRQRAYKVPRDVVDVLTQIKHLVAEPKELVSQSVNPIADASCAGAYSVCKTINKLLEG